MSTNPLDDLLQRLSHGDEAAAEQVFRTYEPYLRMVVRRQLPTRLRCKFDSVDVVQSVWADVLNGFQNSGWSFNNSSQLRAFLVKVTRNRFLDRLRKHERALEHEHPADDNIALMAFDPEPRPSEVAQADELWQKIVTLCPPAHLELLRLKREGRTLNEIAEQTGMHPSSVRRILYDLARRLADQNPATSTAASDEDPLG